jgi:hypothetical protein
MIIPLNLLSHSAFKINLSMKQHNLCCQKEEIKHLTSYFVPYATARWNISMKTISDWKFNLQLCLSQCSSVVEWSELSYDEVLEDKYIRTTVVCGCIIMLFLLLLFVFFVSLSILIIMYVPFCHCVFCLPFVCECVLENWHRNIGTLFDYPNWGFSMLLHQLEGKCQGITRKDGARPALSNLLPNIFLVIVSFLVR